MISNHHSEDIFEQLRNGETIATNHLETSKLKNASFATKKLLVQMNNSSDPEEIRELLSQITRSKIDKSGAVFTPFYINYGKHVIVAAGSVDSKDVAENTIVGGIPAKINR